jgi:hypothetical protein
MMCGSVLSVSGRVRYQAAAGGVLCRVWTSAILIAVSAFFASGLNLSAQSSDASFQFNIPSQPLETALGRYGDVTGREALYDTSVAGGRVSGDLRGKYTPNEALQKLLSGTGLSARFVADDSFVVLSAPLTNRLPASPSVQRRYYGVIQQNLLAALCRSSIARPGRYRIVAMFWIDATGGIENSQRIGSTGAADADRQIDMTLRSVRFGEPPPAGFEQPVLILLVPQSPGVTSGCDKANSAFDPAGMTP